MKRKLRHPIRSITEPYGKAGLLVAILALVLATTGAAFAKGLFSKAQEKKIAAIAKKYAKAGPEGKQGPAGPTGPAGSNGSNGSNGESVKVTTLAKGEGGCTEGGAKFTVGAEEGTACTGAKGAQGKQGEPWTPNNTLPTGATEKGNWAYDAATKGLPEFSGHEFPLTAISFGIPLAAAPASHVIQPGEDVKLAEEKWKAGSEELCEGKSPGTELEECEEKFKALHEACPGELGTPAAASGNLCVFMTSISAPPNGNVLESAPGHFFVIAQTEATGAYVGMLANENEKGVVAKGTWAVTG